MILIAIGDEEEYSRRLVGYLEKHMTEPVRIVRFTDPRQFISQVPREACCITGEDFWAQCLAIREEGDTAKAQGLREERYYRQHIMISERKEEGAFYRYQSPGRLLELLGDAKAGTPGRPGGRELTHTRITAVYSPVYMEDLSQIAADYMKEDAIYLGMEDMGDVLAEEGDMGDLCYYIQLRDEQILDKIREVRVRTGSCYFVSSPPVYFDMASLSSEDYAWFFQKLRASGAYPEVYVGMGSGVLCNPEILRCFDRVILMDSRRNQRQHAFCRRLQKALVSGGVLTEDAVVRRYRKDEIYGPA